MEIVKTENLAFQYARFDQEKNEKEYIEALSGIDISIEKGEFVAVLGHNGSGKSTLAKHINVLLTPTSGKVYVNGMDTSDEENTFPIRQIAGMVFQNPDNQIIATIVEEDVAFGPENLGIEPMEIRRRVDESLAAVNMSEYRRNAPNLLSGGQKQRVAVAGILAMKPDCIVLDESTAMLDPIGRKEVLSTIMRLNKEEGITIIHITHFMEEATQADRVIVMDDGKIAMDDTPKNVFKKVELVKSLGLDVPQVSELANMLRHKGVNLPDDIITIEDMAEEIFRLNKITRPVNPYVVEKEDTSIKQFVENYIEIKNLTYVYSPDTVFEKVAVDNISLNISKGEFFGIIGHTGSGKSTLIQHFNALIKPTSGHVIIDGFDINSDKSKLKSVRQRVGLIFQYPEHQLFETTIYEDVAYGPKNMGLSEAEVKRRVESALTLVGLDKDLYNKSPFELSGGQKRRAAIAGVLAMEPEILVMDEPTAGLDPRGRDEILEQIRFLHKELNNTIIIVSHSMEDIARLTDRLAVLEKGKLRFIGTPREIFTHVEELEQIGLTAPKVSYLVRLLNSKGFDIPEDIYKIEDACEAIYRHLT